MIYLFFLVRMHVASLYLHMRLLISLGTLSAERRKTHAAWDRRKLDLGLERLDDDDMT